MAEVNARTMNWRRLESADNSTENGSPRASDAKKFSAEVSAAVFVRGVTTSITSGWVSAAEARRRRLRAIRMDGSVRRGVAVCELRQLGQLARCGGRQAVFSRTGFDREWQPCPAGEQQTLALAGAEQVLAFL